MAMSVLVVMVMDWDDWDGDECGDGRMLKAVDGDERMWNLRALCGFRGGCNAGVIVCGRFMAAGCTAAARRLVARRLHGGWLHGGCTPHACITSKASAWSHLSG